MPNSFWVTIDVSWSECVVAKNLEEAISLTEKKYRDGKGKIPREYVEVFQEDLNGEFGLASQVED